jgi:ribonucleoside-diphosphate reductase alpha chain
MNKPYQKDRFKYNKENQLDIYNPEFESPIKAISDEVSAEVDEMMDKLYYFASWAKFYPDLFLDMMTPEDSKYHLNLYQRVMLRMLFRFKNNYIVLSRGSAKTFTELLSLILKGIMYPGIRLSVTAESKEQASNILKDKYNELTDEWYPFLKNEIAKVQFGKDTGLIELHNGSKIDVIGAVQTSKGLRRHQGSLEESARMNNYLFKDVIQPIFNIPRRTASGDIDKKELHGALNFFTTSGFRGTEEFHRSLNMVDEMANCKGSFVFGASWELPVFFGLTTKKFVLDIKNDPTTSPTAFAMNYESRWVGASDNALIAMDKIIALRTPSLKVELKREENVDYVIGVDVARSKSQSNNQSAVVVGKLIRNKSDGSIKHVDIVNIVIPPNGLNFTEQALILKRMQKAYNAIAVCVDTNGLGKGLADRLVEDLEDRDNGESFEAWDCMNDETFKSKIPNSPKLLYSLNATGINTNIIINFWDYIETNKLVLLPSEKNAKIDNKKSEQEKVNIVACHMNTDTLLEQISNLEIENINGKYKIKQVTKKIDKDIYSALVYLLYYVQQCENIGRKSNMDDYMSCFMYN